MPRHRVASDENDSQKENAPQAIKVKAEKIRVKEENAKKRKANVNDATYEEQQAHNDEQTPSRDEATRGEQDDDEEEQGEGSPRGHKRARVNAQGESRPSQTDEPEEAREAVKTLPRDTDGFIPGSIVRIQLKNFVTYDFVEFYPGSHLNMIIGPNGTGKSSIACAICLGLNWPPAILGRANELNTFVKNDTDSGYIEIELKGPKGKPNLIIRRNLSAKSKASTFTLNGSPATGREISQKMAELNVQVGNLCSFLPQDKVSEFAAMTPQQLLKETQRAAGDAHLSSWHETLITAGKELRTMTETIKSETDQLKQMKDRNENIERDVQRVRERQKIEHEIALLEVLIPVQEYRELRLKFMELKQEQRRLHERVKMLRERNEPAHDLLKKLDAQSKALEKVRDKMKKNTQNTFGKMQQKMTENETLETETDDLNNKLDRLHKEEKDRANRIRQAEAKIEKCKEDLKLDVKLEKEDDLKAEHATVASERRDIAARNSVLDQSMNANIASRTRLDAQQSQIYNSLQKLDNVDVQKMSNLRSWDPVTFDALVWLRENQHRFKMPILEPPVISMTMKDKKFTNAVEACFSANQLKTFVAQCREDYDAFNRIVQDGEALGRKVRVSTWFREQKRELYYPPPMEEDELKRLKFDGYALKYVTYPEELLWFLQADINLHRTAVALNENSVPVAEAMDAVARSGGANFITNMTMHQVSRSRYGSKAVQNSTRSIRPARNLATLAVDADAKKRFETSLKELKLEMSVLEEEKTELRKQLANVAAEDAEITKRLNAINARRQLIVKERGRVAKLKGDLDRFEKALTALHKVPSPELARPALKKKILEVTKKRAICLREFNKLARSVITEQMEATRLGLQFLQICANRAALKELCDKKEKNYQKAVVDFNNMDQLYERVKAQSKEALERSKETIRNTTPELRAEYDAIAAARVVYEEALKDKRQNDRDPPTEGVDLRTSEDLAAELDAQRAHLDITLATNPGVVEQYEKRKRDIETLEKTLEERQRKADKVDRNIKNARDNWKPALESLVGSIGAKFSAAFDRIGCAGEIRISENDDYEKWAIDILVKFRDDEKLQLLTGQRQSGGERSLTTILYLMSLTEEARAPFSLVDEINQGMDQRAERVVHNSMVDVTCKDDSAQYFLITPKLLADLNYHEKMKVLCVNNGEWLPEERSLGNMMNMIEGFVQRRNSNRSNAAS